jgi:hypothetical protein
LAPLKRIPWSDVLTSVHNRTTAGCFAFSAMLGEGCTELFELQKRGNLAPSFASTEF